MTTPRKQANVSLGGAVIPEADTTFSVPFIRGPYNYDTKAASEEAAYVEHLPSLTVQSQSEDTDLNVLMRRYGITGKLPENPRMPSYGDFTEVRDFASAMNAVLAAEESFMELPADLRARFQNNPQKLLEFCATPGNADEGVKLGLWKAPPPVSPGEPPKPQGETAPVSPSTVTIK